MLTTVEEWRAFLPKWEAAARNSDLPPDIRALSSFAEPPANEAELDAFRKRFHVDLPRSYRAFVLATNGWHHACRAVPHLRPLGAVDWFKAKNRSWITAYTKPISFEKIPLPPEEAYYTYAPGVAQEFRPEHFRHTFQISDIGDAAVILLNPQVVHTDGEWEAWFLANWLPGVQRYRSFADFIARHHHQALGNPLPEPDATPISFDQLPTVYKDPPGREPRRVERRKPRRPVEELLRVAQDRSARTTISARLTAIKELAARREAAAIPTLRKLLHDPHPDAVDAAMTALGEMQAAEAVADLIAMAQSREMGHRYVVHALGAIGTEAAREFLAAHLAAEPTDSTAAWALATAHDERGVRALLAMMHDTSKRHPGDIAGKIAAEFGPAAVDGLCAAASHENAVVRRRAVDGLGAIVGVRLNSPEGQQAAKTLLERHVHETDEKVRSFIEVYLHWLPRKRES